MNNGDKKLDATLVQVFGSIDTPRPSVRFNGSIFDLQAINPPDLFHSGSLFTQVMVAPRGRTVWISGQIGCGSDNNLIGDGKAEQIEQAFENLRAAIASGGCRPGNCVRITEYLVNYSQSDIGLIQPHIQALFPKDKLPTNVLVPVPRLGRDRALFEIDAVCILPD